MDNWITATLAPVLRAAADPQVIDLGFGSHPVTTVEMAARLRRIRPDVRVLGLELDPDRVAAALPAADPPRLDFARGGFELAGHRPTLIRAANVLRQYDEAAAARAWSTLRRNLAPGGVLVEGTSDELGRRASWVLLDASGPISLTLACRVESLDRPGDLAERLPKSLIHRNVPGEAIHRFLLDLDAGWDAAVPLSAFGARQRWIAACATVADRWPVRRDRCRFGELSVDWSAIAPS
jgi:hypothetical protein